MILTVPFKDKKIEATIDNIDGKEECLTNKIWIVLTHGAGGDLNVPQLTAVAQYLSKSNFVVFRFTCKGLNIKHRISVFAEMLKFIFNSYSPKGMFIGGRSMGARAAAMISVNDLPIPVFEKILGVICLSYPLHKANQMKDLRDTPLRQSKKPLLFLSGTKDEMCDKILLQNVLKDLKCPYKVHWLDGCNHSAKPKDNYSESFYVDAFEEIVKWCKNMSET